MGGGVVDMVPRGGPRLSIWEIGENRAKSVIFMKNKLILTFEGDAARIDALPRPKIGLGVWGEVC